jgi:hypothetical protein
MMMMARPSTNHNHFVPEMGRAGPPRYEFKEKLHAERGPQTYSKKIVQDFILRGAAGRPYDVDYKIAFCCNRSAFGKGHHYGRGRIKPHAYVYWLFFIFETADIPLFDSRVLSVFSEFGIFGIKGLMEDSYRH